MKNYINTSLLFVLLFSVTSEIKAQQIVQIKSEETLRSEHFLKSIKPVSKSNSIAAVYHEADLSSPNDFELSLTSIEHGSSKNEYSESRTSELRQLKSKTKLDPFKLVESSETSNIALINGFEGNAYNSWYPSDNAMAVSNEGYIVSLTNSSISFYNTGGVIFLNSQSLGQFYDFLGLGYFFFDPRIIYDAESDRFIIVCLYSNAPASNRVVISVSETGNPMDGWNTMTIHASEIEESTWFDYPNVGISSEDIFISGNMFTSNGTFSQSVVIQMEKEALFNGEVANWELFEDISEGTGMESFTIKPVSSGLEESYEDGIYMVSTNSAGGSDFLLYKITGNLASDQELEIFVIPTESYSSPIEAGQNGSDKKLLTGGVRVRDGLIANNKIHFVHTTDYVNGYAGVRYTKFNLDDFTSESIDYGLQGFDYAYPSISVFETTNNQSSVLVSCLRSGESLYPEIRAFKVDNYMNATNSILIKSGESPIALSNNVNQRWGDYTSTVVQFGTDEPTIWVFGCYGKDMKFGNFIGEVSLGNNGNPPISDFTASNNFGISPLSVSFSDEPSTAVENRHWSFPGGNPSFSTEANPIVEYDTPGVYEVTLTVSNAFGTHEVTKYEFVQVGVLPAADIFVTSTEVTVDENVIFQGIAFTEIDEWEWIIEGANIQYHNTQNPVVLFEQVGTYSVELKVTNAFGSQQIIKEDYIVVDKFSSTGSIGVATDLFVYPNPAMNSFSLDMQLKDRLYVEIELMDSSGKVVRKLFNGALKSGIQRLNFNTNVLSQGVYYLVVRENSGKILSNEKIIINSP